MVEPFLNLLPLILGAALAVVWIVALVNHDGSSCEPGKGCDSCPFPCDRRGKSKK